MDVKGQRRRLWSRSQSLCFVNKVILYNPSIFKQILSALNDQVRRRLAVLHTEKQSSLTGGLEELYGWRAV